MSLFNELKRRNVFRVAIAYVIVAWLVMQIADVVLNNITAPDWVFQVLMLFLAVGLPIAVIFAWAFEMTAEGLKREHEVDRSQSITRHTGRKLDFAIIAMLAAAIIYLVVDNQVLERAPGADSDIERSIAVLPFRNRSNIAEDAFFVDGMADDLLTLLSRLSSVDKVIARTSTEQYRDTTKTIPQIGQELDVATILEGGVQRSGKQVRINVQLIDTKTGGHLWAEIYDRVLTVENLFQIQSEITREIVAALHGVLSEQDDNTLQAMPTTSLDAYDLYLRGRYLWQRRGEDNIRHAIELFTKATELDPRFGRAWSSLAAAQLTLTAWSDASEAEQYPLALSAAQKALKIDDSLAEAHAVLAEVTRFEEKWAEAKAYYLRAIASEPKNSTAHLWYGQHLDAVGHSRDALEEYLIAYRLDPLHPSTNFLLARTYLWLGDTSNALRFGAATWDLGTPRGLSIQAQANQRLGKFERAMEFIEQWAEQDSDSAFNDAFRLFLEAKVDAAKTPLYFEFLVDNESVLPTGFVLWGHAAFDRIDDAYRMLKRAPDSMNGDSWVFFWSPYLAAFRQDPRFAEHVTEHGLVDYWREHGWPDACQPAGDSVICE